MADLQKTVEIIFGGRNELSKTIGEVESSLSRLEGATDPFANLADSVLKAEAAFMALAAGGLLYAFNKSKEFESATIDLQKVIGDSPADLEAARENAIALSETYGESASAILASTASFKQAGYTVQESMQLTKAAMDLVIAGDVEATSASEILIATLKGFDAPASDATRLLDSLNEVSNKYATDVEQLAIGMSKLSPIAKTMGFSFEETEGILTPVIEVFRSGDEAATALKTGLLKLIDDTKPVNEALEMLGVSQRDANGELRSGKDILFDVSTAFQKLDENQKLFVTQQLVGIDQSAKMVQVFDNLHKSTEITSVAMGSAGSAAQEVAARLDSSEVAVNRFSTAFVNLSTSIGDKFRDAATEAINGGTEIENALRGVVDSGGLDGLLNFIESQASDLGTLLSSIAKNIPEAFSGIDWSGLISSFDVLKTSVNNAFETVFGDIDLSTVDGVRSAVQKFVDILAGLTRTSAGVIDGMNPLFTAIGALAENFLKAGADGQGLAGNILGVGKSINSIVGFVSGATGAVGGLTSALLLMGGSSVINSISNIVSLIGGSTGLTSVFLAAKPAVLALGAAWGTLEVIKLGSVLYEIVAANKDLKESQEEAARGAVQLADKFEEVSKSTGLQITSMEELDQAVKDGKIHFDEASASWVSGSDKIANSAQTLSEKYVEISNATGIQITTFQEYENAINSGAITFDQATQTWVIGSEEVARSAEEVAQSLRDVGLDVDKNGNIKEFVTATEDGLKSTEAAAKGTKDAWVHTADGVYTNLGVVSTSIDKVTESEQKAKEETDALKQTMLELASNERIKSMELTADLHIAEIKADAEILKAAFESVSESVSSTNDLIGDLGSSIAGLGDLTNGNWLEFEALRDSMRKADERAAELTDAQVELMGAQSDYIQQKTDSLRSGGSLITINGDGLAPQLEAFMWEVLKAIQVRAVEEEASFLLGI